MDEEKIEEKNKGKSIVLSMTALLLFFYMAIILYVLFQIVHINTLQNFVMGMFFEIIGFCMLLYVFLGNSKSIKFEYFVPIIIITLIYTVFLNILNIGCILLPSGIFGLLHIVLLFVYLIIFAPMFIMGKK